MTTAPAAANFGANAFDDVAPAEKSAMSMPARSAVAASSTTMSSSRNRRVLPALRADAKRRSLPIGKSRSSSNRNITVPT